MNDASMAGAATLVDAILKQVKRPNQL